MTTVNIEGDMHEVTYYTDDTGHGLTRCGRTVLPCDATYEGDVTCRKCKEAHA